MIFHKVNQWIQWILAVNSNCYNFFDHIIINISRCSHFIRIGFGCVLAESDNHQSLEALLLPCEFHLHLTNIAGYHFLIVNKEWNLQFYNHSLQTVDTEFGDLSRCDCSWPILRLLSLISLMCNSRCHSLDTQSHKPTLSTPARLNLANSPYCGPPIKWKNGRSKRVNS